MQNYSTRTQIPNSISKPHMTLPSSDIDSGQLVAQASIRNTDATIGKLLQDAGKLKQQDMERVLKLQHEQNLRFGEAALKLGLVTQADIQHALSFQFEYPYLANDREGLGQELVAAIAPYGKEAEAFRSVRAQLLLGWFQEGRKALAIGSARAGEGASYLAANLAVLFAQLGRKTLLVDADMRQPRQHQIFNLGNSKGLSDILAGRADATIAAPIKSFPALSVLPSGSPPPNPGELLVRPAFATLLNSLENSYDIILIDTSPSEHVSDFQAVSAITGGVLISARRNVSRLSLLELMKEKISLTGAQVIGAVVLG